MRAAGRPLAWIWPCVVSAPATDVADARPITTPPRMPVCNVVLSVVPTSGPLPTTRLRVICSSSPNAT